MREGNLIYRIWKAKFVSLDPSSNSDCFIVDNQLFLRLKDGYISSNDYALLDEIQ